MHALGEYLSSEIKRRGWTAAELARRAGLTKQSISNLMDADKTELGRMLERRTFAGLAEALGVPPETVVLKAAEAMGIPVPPPPEANNLHEAPPVTMEELETFLRESDLPIPVLATYLHRYLRLADVVAQTMAEQAHDGDDNDPGRSGGSPGQAAAQLDGHQIDGHHVDGASVGLDGHRVAMQAKTTAPSSGH